ncbi:MAG: hypothetical protein KKE11_06840 [Gammaproteobacteria bacterium]|nr:hypothetical protein [Gammaproteobacteria bacterium]
MLPEHPLSILNIFSNSIKASKRIFIPMLPISIIWIITGITGILGFFCFCWGVCYVYERLSGLKEASHTHSFVAALKRFWPILFLFFLLVIFLGLVAANTIPYYLVFTSDIASTRAAFDMPSSVIVFVLFFYWFFGFAAIYIFEILIRNSKFSAAISKAFRVTLSVSVIWRIFCFFMLFVFINFIVAAMIFGLFSLSAYVWSGFVLWDMVRVMVSLLILLFGFVLHVNLFVYFCNDLVMCYENRALS